MPSGRLRQFRHHQSRQLPGDRGQRGLCAQPLRDRPRGQDLGRAVRRRRASSTASSPSLKFGARYLGPSPHQRQCAQQRPEHAGRDQRPDAGAADHHRQPAIAARRSPPVATWRATGTNVTKLGDVRQRLPVPHLHRQRRRAAVSRPTAATRATSTCASGSMRPMRWPTSGRTWQPAVQRQRRPALDQDRHPLDRLPPGVSDHDRSGRRHLYRRGRSGGRADQQHRAGQLQLFPAERERRLRAVEPAEAAPRRLSRDRAVGDRELRRGDQPQPRRPATGGPNNIIFNATTGNPNLKPLRAWNADASLELYASKDTLVSVAGYYKWVDRHGDRPVRADPDRRSPSRRSPTAAPRQTRNLTINPVAPAERSRDAAPLRRRGDREPRLHLAARRRSTASGSRARSTARSPISSFPTRRATRSPHYHRPANLIGLSKWTASGSVYYEKWGLSLRANFRYRSGYYKPNGGTNREVRDGSLPEPVGAV